MANILILGDCNNVGGSLSDEILDPSIQRLFHDADVIVFNTEGPILSDPSKRQLPIRNPFLLKALNLAGKPPIPIASTPSLLNLFPTQTATVACLANNHILDGGERGVNETIQNLEQRRVHSVGAGRTRAAAQQPLLITIKGERIGFVNYNLVGIRKHGLFLDIYGARRNRAGANSASFHLMADEIASLKTKTDLCIAIVHAGSILTERLPMNLERNLAALPADLVVVHHPHQSQRTSFPNVVSVGDFFFQAPNIPSTRYGSIVQRESGTTTIHPIRITDGIPSLMTGQRDG